MPENTLTDKFKDLPDSLTYRQACGVVLRAFGKKLAKTPFMTGVPLVLITGAAALIGGPYLAAGAPALGFLFAAKKMQVNGSKAGLLAQLLPQQEQGIHDASELLAHADEQKKEPLLRAEFMRKAVFYSYFFDRLSTDLNLSAQARETQARVESQIGAESPTGLECLRLVNRLNAVQGGALATIFTEAVQAVRSDPQAGFMAKFEEAAGSHLGEAAFGGHADIYDVGLITEMCNYIRKTAVQPE